MVMDWSQSDGSMAQLLLQVPGSHTGAGSRIGYSTSHPAPCLQSLKVVEKGPKPWNVALKGEP